MYTKKRKRFARAMCGLPYMALFFLSVDSENMLLDERELVETMSLS